MTSAKPIIVINENYEEEALPHPYTSRPLREVQLKLADREDYDGGRAWLVMGAGFFAMILIFGVELTFGIYFLAYKESFKNEDSVIAWIGSISYGVMFLSGPLASILISRVGTRTSMAIAGILTCLGFGTSYFAEDAYHLYISFGFLVGSGMGIAFLCCYAVLPHYFKKYLRIASIIVSIGGGVGIFLFSALFDYLITEYGWRGSHLINAGICLHFFFFALIMKSRPADPTQLKPRLSQLMGVQVLASVKFRLYLLHIILWNIGFIIVFSLLNSFVKDVGGLTDGEANLISMFVGILNTVGRIASVPLERFFNPIKLYVAMTILMGLFEMLIAAGVTQAGYTITSSAAGMFFGIMICFLVPVIGEFLGFGNVTAALGYSNFMQGVGGLIGTPILALLPGGNKFLVGGAVTTTSGLVIGYAAFRHLKDVKRMSSQQDGPDVVANTGDVDQRTRYVVDQ